MAGLGAKLFPAFSKLTSAQVNGYLMDQTIMRFASASARDAAFGGVGEPTLAEGMTCYLDDTNVLQSYNGSAWVEIACTDGKAPRGVVGTATRTAGNVTLGPAQADITGMSTTFTAVAGRLYRANWSVNFQKVSTSGWTECFLTDSANVSYGIAIAYTVASSYGNVSGSTIISGLTAGSKTFKLRLECEANTAQVFALSGAPCVLIIEDIGSSL